MICPKCGNLNQKYKQRRDEFQGNKDNKFKRTDFTIKPCKKCGYEGEA